MMANPFGGYQSAFSMFLESHQDDSLDSKDTNSKDTISSENSKDSGVLPESARQSRFEPVDLRREFDESNDISSSFPTCPSTDSISEQFNGDSSTVTTFKPQMPPPSEDANQEAVQLEAYDQESMDCGDIPEESVDDTPHFQAAFDRTPEQDTLDSVLSDVASVSSQLPATAMTPEVENSCISDDKSLAGELAQDQAERNTASEAAPDQQQDETHINDQESPHLAAAKVFEYQWPQEPGGDIFMIQEQLSEFLNILSFKRKYPDLTRHAVDYKERIFLMDRGAVTETQCDLGLTALRSEEVYELMSKDYPSKYKDYIEVLRERERKRVTEQHKGYSGMQSIEKAKVDFLVKKAVKSAADFNAQFMREKREDRRAYLDLQTLEVHYPRSKIRVVSKEFSKPSNYPVALIPGQYQHYYKRYTPQELKYFPVKTALYSPHKVLKSIYADPQDAEDKDTADEEEKKDNDSSSSDSSQSGSSDSEADSIEPETNEVKISEEQIKKLLATPRPDTPPKKQRRRAPQNQPQAADSEKDGEAGTVKTPRRKIPKTPSRKSTTKAPRGRPKGRPPLPHNLQCNICQETGVNDKDGNLLELAQCSECFKYAHIVCLELTDEMIPIIKTYPWQCMECKICIKCKDAQDEEKMMFCDHCDRGYHTFCLGLEAIPPGRWECPSCQPETEPSIPTETVEPAAPTETAEPAAPALTTEPAAPALTTEPAAPALTTEPAAPTADEPVS